ncbi:MAG: 7-cyano-7-deazaguanine synthase QueC [Candidatus Omnitrophica bacterium]|nr:7-cyano-7-deazaguanine synthase QueC [Candidatus Omnitrophota bacterium]MCG2704816.1 7-cyano-7-deazaguanine synthase QueC [Candidatus Omnitrophota bacterium]
MKKAIVLLSGGLDSATTLALALRKGYDCRCLIFDYGQRHKKEVRHAVKIAKAANCGYNVIKLPFSWRGSSLLNKKAPLPRRGIKEMGKDIPSTYVPSRNTVFLSVAASVAESSGAGAIFIGANAVDYSGYPDCRPEYFKAFEALLKKGIKSGKDGRHIKIITPLIGKTKAEIVKIGSRLNVPYHLTWSCYAGKKIPCMECDSCLLREKGFREAGIKDSLV